MKKTILSIATLTIILVLAITCTDHPKTTKDDTASNLSDSGVTADLTVTPDPIEAMNNPSKHAWDLFLKLNHPARAITMGRGMPDETKKIGDSGLVVWETWKNAGTEVFLDNGRTPPNWEDFSLDPYLNKKGITLEASTNILIAALDEKKPKQFTLEQTQIFNRDPHALFDPNDGLPDSGGGETRMNKSSFDFIIKNQLYNLGGLYKFRTDYYAAASANRKALSFELESIECKGMWREFSAEELKNGTDKKYYVAIDGNGKKYGLTSLHIITKEIPNWFWCTFRHKDGPAPEIPSVDTYGQPATLKGTFWENYELSGTQTDFTDPRGFATKLSDPIIEGGFEQSSCITCHSTAVVGPGAMRFDGGRLLFTQSQVFQPGKIGETVGTPKPTWFQDQRTNKDSLLQTDFVYSIPFRARKKQ